MGTFRFSIRSLLATMLVVAVVTPMFTLVAGPDLASKMPILLGSLGAICGIVWTGGRGNGCLIATTLCSALGMTVWVCYAVFVVDARFVNWSAPLVLIAFSSILGLLLAVGVRFCMEGLSVRKGE